MSEQTIIPNSDYVKPCRKCGAQDRNKQGVCRPCQLLAVKKYQSKNPERVKCSAKKYYDKNKEKRVAAAFAWNKANSDKFKEHLRKSSHNWYLANLDRHAENNRKWRNLNPDKLREYDHNRRTRVKGNGGKLSSNIIQTLFILQKGKCACCDKSLNDGYHLDHIMPIKLGGTNTDDNVQLLTPKCNLRKGSKHPDKWARENGRLF